MSVLCILGFPLQIDLLTGKHPGFVVLHPDDFGFDFTEESVTDFFFNVLFGHRHVPWIKWLVDPLAQFEAVFGLERRSLDVKRPIDGKVPHLEDDERHVFSGGLLVTVEVNLL
jgi:hypothetical protein